MYFLSSSSLSKVRPIARRTETREMDRRGFLGGVLGFVATANAQIPASQVSPGPLVWPTAAKLQTKIRSFDGHTDTVLDVFGRIGTPASLVIFTEGNHLMVLSSNDIVGAFMSWAKSHPQYADLDLTNIVLVTLPQPILLEMVRTGGVTLGNLTLDVSRSSGFYPDIFMGYAEPLRQLRRLGVIGPEARFFCKNRGVALLVRNGNPLGIHDLPDVVRAGVLGVGAAIPVLAAMQLGDVVRWIAPSAVAAPWWCGSIGLG